MELIFENPEYLWLLATLPFLVIGHYLFLRYAQKRALNFANFRALKRVTGERLVTKNYFQLAVRILVFFALILAAAGAVLWHEGESNRNDYVIVIDTSSSMTSQDVAPTRLEAAKENAILFLDSLRGETRVGLVTFAGVAFIRAVPTSDLERVKEAVRRVDPLPAGGTDIPAAIITSTNLLLEKDRGRAIILISDGSSTIETFLDDSLQHAVQYAQEHHVRIHTIGLGTNLGPIGYLPRYYNVSAVYNEENLLHIANETGGSYVKAEENEELREAFEAIAGATTKEYLRKDLRGWLLIAALALLFFEWVLSNTRYRHLP